MHKKPMNGFRRPIQQITASLVSLLAPLGVGEGFFKPMKKRTEASDAEMRAFMREQAYRAQQDKRLANAAPARVSRQVARSYAIRGR